MAAATVTAPSGVPRWLVALVLAVLILSYGAIVLATTDIWQKGKPGHAVQASLSVEQPPGTTATPTPLTGHARPWRSGSATSAATRSPSGSTGTC